MSVVTTRVIASAVTPAVRPAPVLTPPALAPTLAPAAPSHTHTNPALLLAAAVHTHIDADAVAGAAAANAVVVGDESAVVDAVAHIVDDARDDMGMSRARVRCHSPRWQHQQQHQQHHWQLWEPGHPGVAHLHHYYCRRQPTPLLPRGQRTQEPDSLVVGVESAPAALARIQMVLVLERVALAWENSSHSPATASVPAPRPSSLFSTKEVAAAEAVAARIPAVGHKDRTHTPGCPPAVGVHTLAVEAHS